MSIPTPRAVDAIDRAIAGVRARQLEKIVYRDRRERDMLTALADVERIEGQIESDAANINALLAERERSAHPERFAPDARIADQPPT